MAVRDKCCCLTAVVLQWSMRLATSQTCRLNLKNIYQLEQNLIGMETYFKFCVKFLYSYQGHAQADP